MILADSRQFVTGPNSPKVLFEWKQRGWRDGAESVIFEQTAKIF